MKIYGIWYGGASYSHGDLGDIEEFTSLAAAKEALQDRYDSNGLRQVPFYKTGEGESWTLVPCVGTDSYIDVMSGPEDSEPDFVARILFGPRGGVKVERA